MSASKLPPEFTHENQAQTTRQRQAFELLKRLGRQESERDLGPESVTLNEQRIDVLMRTMRDGRWETGKSDVEFAELWGLSRRYVRGLATEASRNLRAQLREVHDDRVALITDIRETFFRLARKAEKIGTAHALQVAGANLDRAADYLGLKPALKLETAGDPFKDWTREELQLYLDTGAKPKRDT